jgi:hypothetical protein
MMPMPRNMNVDFFANPAAEHNHKDITFPINKVNGQVSGSSFWDYLTRTFK